MNVKLDDGPVDVTLSRRNLLELLAELDSLRDEDGDMRPGDPATLARVCGEGLFLRVTAEEDDVHYGDRTPGTLGMVNP